MLARILAVALAVAATGSALAAPPTEKKFGAWSVGPLSDGSGSYAATMNDSGGVLGLFCYRESQKCVWLIANDLQCEDDSQYPVLVNSDTGAFTTVIVCHKNGEKPRYAFANYDEIEGPILKADWLGMAFPMASGKFTVSRHSLKGAREAVAFLHKLMAGAEKRPAAQQGTKDFSL